MDCFARFTGECFTLWKWSAFRNREGIFTIYPFELGTDKDRAVAEVYREADAVLSASAPELYSVLAYMTEAMRANTALMMEIGLDTKWLEKVIGFADELFARIDGGDEMPKSSPSSTEKISLKDDPEDITAFLKDWDKELSKSFSGEIHKRLCDNSQLIYTVMREGCAVLDWLLCEETYHVQLTMQIREKLAKILRIIDGADEQI